MTLAEQQEFTTTPMTMNEPSNEFPHGAGSHLTHIAFLEAAIEDMEARRAAMNDCPAAPLPEDATRDQKDEYYEAKKAHKAAKAALTRQVKEAKGKLRILKEVRK